MHSGKSSPDANVRQWMGAEWLWYGPLGTEVLDFLIAVPYPVPNGTSLDNPALGVYFQAACDAHDACYGSGYGQATCDAQFATDLATACNASPNPLCGGYANTYHYGVQALGGGPYAQAAAKLTCAAWNEDLQENDCD
jgi:hypothetical protein